MGRTVATGTHLAAIERDDELSPDEEDGVRECCDAVLCIVEKPSHTQKEIEAAEEQLRAAEQIREAASRNPSQAMIDALGKQRKAAAERLDKADVEQQIWQPYATLRADLRRALDGVTDPSPPRAHYIRLARTVRKAELLRRFVELLDAFNDTGIRASRQKRGEDLLRALLPGPNESLRRASEIVRETEQNISREDVADEINAGEARIEIDPPRPFPYQLVTLRIDSKRPGFDSAEARRELKCVWTVDGEKLEADGWTIGHYFEREPTSARLGKWFRERVLRHAPAPPRTLEGAATVAVAPAGKALEPLPVRVEDTESYVESRTFLAFGALLITVFVVGIGLLAGAVDKLQTLDWMSGLVATVLPGFGADVLKKLITRS
jgi:hypothetical protein